MIKIKPHTLTTTLFLLITLIACSSQPELSSKPSTQNPPKLNGLQEEYYPNGLLKKSIHMKEGLKHGVMNLYYDDGSILKSSQWEDGQQIGTQVEYDYEQNKIIRTYFEVERPLKDTIPLTSIEDESKVGSLVNAVKNTFSNITIPDAAKQEVFKQIQAFLEDDEVEDILQANQQGVEYTHAFAKGTEAAVVGIYEEYQALLGADFHKIYQELMNPNTWDSLYSVLSQGTLADARKLIEVGMNEYVAAFESRYQEYAITKEQRPYFNGGYFAGEYIASLIAGRIALKVIPSHSTHKIAHVKSRPNLIKHQVNSRLPRKDGHWKGLEGESKWQSYKPKVLKVTRGRPIRFYHQRPDFSPWSRGSFNYKQGRLKGDHSDFGMVKNSIKDKYNFRTQDDVQKWLDKENLTIHHVDTKQVQLIPSDLHNNIPHVGGAAEARALN